MQNEGLSALDRRVLVIDDDEGDCCLVEDILAEEGIAVTKAVGGEAGIHQLSKQSFPVVITDLRMPDIDGFAIIDFLHKQHLDTLVVVITGSARTDDVIEALRVGAYDYIIKPFGPDLLRLTIRRAFDYLAMREDHLRLRHVDLVAQLATTTAHEVFQPLTVLMGRANEIAKDSDDEHLGELAGEVLVQARKIRDIVRRLDNLQEYAIKTFPGGHQIIDIAEGDDLYPQRSSAADND